MSASIQITSGSYFMSAVKATADEFQNYSSIDRPMNIFSMRQAVNVRTELGSSFVATADFLKAAGDQFLVCNRKDYVSGDELECTISDSTGVKRYFSMFIPNESVVESVSYGDIDKDGDRDVAVSLVGENYLWVFKNEDVLGLSEFNKFERGLVNYIRQSKPVMLDYVGTTGSVAVSTGKATLKVDFDYSPLANESSKLFLWAKLSSMALEASINSPYTCVAACSGEKPNMICKGPDF